MFKRCVSLFYFYFGIQRLWKWTHSVAFYAVLFFLSSKSVTWSSVTVLNTRKVTFVQYMQKYGYFRLRLCRLNGKIISKKCKHRLQKRQIAYYLSSYIRFEFTSLPLKKNYILYRIWVLWIEFWRTTSAICHITYWYQILSSGIPSWDSKMSLMG